MKKIKSKKKLLKTKKRLFPFISSFYFISILARLFLLFLIAFIISKIFLSTLFPPKNIVYASYCCGASRTISILPFNLPISFQNGTCTQSIPTIDTLPFTIGSTTYYQLPATVRYYVSSTGVCK